MRRHVMVDIETLATTPNAHIIQIGACWGAGDQVFMDDNFLVSVEERDGAMYHIDPRTVNWWRQQGPAARDSLQLNLVATVDTALEDFNSWLSMIGFTKKQNQWCIWANPPQFDLSILQHAYRSEGVQCPWHYRQERCCRTIYNEVARGSHPPVPNMPEGLVAHRADHDAVRQLHGILPVLGE